MSLLSLLLRPRSFEERLDVVVVEYLVVAGGGGGGEVREAPQSNPFPLLAGGGGGAGGVLSGSRTLLRGATATVSVGGGGTGGSEGDGGNSVLDNLTAFGGGGGGVGGGNGRAGGSGGGGGQQAAGGTPSGGAAGAGTAGQGGNGFSGTVVLAGNGGGTGTSSSITGTLVTYGVGGIGNLPSDQSPPSSNPGSGGIGGRYNTLGCINVSDAGSEEYNGTYCSFGTYGVYEFGEAPTWRLDGTDKYIYLRDGLTWAIGTLDPFEAYFLNSLVLDENGIPIYSGPSFEAVTAVNGLEPSPLVSTSPVLYAPEGGSPGVVIVAYPDTLPAITVSGGLAYDQPTRSGYRVYRFAAGSGTITFP